MQLLKNNTKGGIGNNKLYKHIEHKTKKMNKIKNKV